VILTNVNSHSGVAEKLQLKFTSVGLFTSVGSFISMSAFTCWFLCGLFTLIYYYMGAFHSREAPLVGGSEWFVPALLLLSQQCQNTEMI